MPFDSMLVSAGVVSMFVVFASALIWGELQMRSKPQTRPSPSKHRSF